MADVQQAVVTPMRDESVNGGDHLATVAPKRDARQSKPKTVPHLTAAERAARGKAARAVAPRLGQGDWEPASHRRDVVELLEEQAASRVPELVPLRYGRMLVSPFT